MTELPRPRRKQLISSDETVAFDGSRLSCRGPRELNYAERAVLFTRTWDGHEAS